MDAAWFWSCLRTGTCQPLKPYLVKIPASVKAKTERIARDAHSENTSKQEISGARPRAVQLRDESKSSRTVPVKIPSETSHAAIGEKQKPGADFLEAAKPPMANEGLGSRLDKDALGKIKKRPSPFEHEESHEDPSKSQTPNQIEAQYAPFDGPRDGSVAVPNPRDELAQPSENTMENQPNKSDPTAPEKESINSVIQDLLRKKKSSTASNQSTGANQGKKKRLLGRALSNLSNSSKEGTATRPSRASSIDSMNTDGVGSVILDENSQAGRSKTDADGASESARRSVNDTLTGKAVVKESISIPESLDPGEHPYYEEQNEAEEPMPPLTQLGWDDPDEAKKLRELMVDRKKKAKYPEEGVEEAPPTTTRVERKIRDDEALLGATTKWGGGRRTRTKTTRSPNRTKVVF